jgi:hypothetical protein
MNSRAAWIFTIVILIAMAISSAAGVSPHQNVAYAQSTNSDAVVPAPVWEKAPQQVVKAVTVSITDQLKAFKANNYAKASFYQSAAMKQNFASVDDFRTMMRQTYPEFANFKSVTFGPMFSTIDRQQVQAPVILTGADGVKVAAIYLLTNENGGYRVAGVVGGAHGAPAPISADPTIS